MNVGKWKVKASDLSVPAELSLEEAELIQELIGEKFESISHVDAEAMATIVANRVTDTEDPLFDHKFESARSIYNAIKSSLVALNEVVDIKRFE